jgi:hypothetical protein
MDRGKVVEAFNRENDLSEWRMTINSLPTYTRDRDLLDRRNQLIRKVGGKGPVIFERRVIPGPSDIGLKDVRKDLMTALARYDTIADIWEEGDAEFWHLYAPHKEAMQQAAEPHIEELRQIPEQRENMAAPWLNLESEDPRREEAGESARFLARLRLDDVDLDRANEMMSLTIHLRDAAMTEDEETLKEGRMNFLKAIKYETNMALEYNDVVAAIEGYEAKVPNGIANESPIWSTVELIARNWEDIWEVMTYRAASDEVRKSLGTVKEWFQQAARLVNSLEEDKQSPSKDTT